MRVAREAIDNCVVLLEKQVGNQSYISVGSKGVLLQILITDVMNANIKSVECILKRGKGIVIHEVSHPSKRKMLSSKLLSQIADEMICKTIPTNVRPIRKSLKVQDREL